MQYLVLACNNFWPAASGLQQSVAYEACNNIHLQGPLQILRRLTVVNRATTVPGTPLVYITFYERLRKGPTTYLPSLG